MLIWKPVLFFILTRIYESVNRYYEFPFIRFSGPAQPELCMPGKKGIINLSGMEPEDFFAYRRPAMKLNYRRTICVGFAFFLICAFWQAYDNTIPLILTNKFGMKQTWSGMIMALDNILALFLLPLFGSLSDRCRSTRGRRTPFILWGTLAAAAALTALSFADAAQLKRISAVSAIDDPAALETLYDAEGTRQLLTPDGETFVLAEQFDRDTFAAIRSQTETEDGRMTANPMYARYVVPARSAYAWDVTSAAPGCLVLFIFLLLAVLIAMSVFRSPAVALMPDVTIKPLRSKANAVINLMGTFGGILVLVLGMLFATGAVRNSLMSYTVYYGVIAGIMLAALLIFMLTVHEPCFVREMHAESSRYGLTEMPQDAAPKSPPDQVRDTGRRKGLSAAEKRSLAFMLASIVLWFTGYNAVTSKYSVYAGNILNRDYNLTLIIAQLAAIVSYLPVGIIASKAGRKKTILAGVILLAAAFGGAAFMRSDSPAVIMNALFALAGIAWATINVNSFPMVVEMCSEAEVGKYTGFYYTASMAAQVITPIFSGFLMDHLGMTVLFPYAVIFAAAAFFTMLMVRHGDSRPTAKKGLEALEDMDAD